MLLPRGGTGTGTVTPRPGDMLEGDLTPFGTRFVGKLDLNNVGTMGHSRGGGVFSGTYTIQLTGATAAVVPEPATWALFGLGAAGLFGDVRRRRATA